MRDVAMTTTAAVKRIALARSVRNTPTPPEDCDHHGRPEDQDDDPGCPERVDDERGVPCRTPNRVRVTVIARRVESPVRDDRRSEDVVRRGRLELPHFLTSRRVQC